MTTPAYPSQYTIGPSNLPPQNVIFQSPATNEEMLRIAPDGFYVRGVKVEQGPDEAKAVFEAFTQWLAHCR